MGITQSNFEEEVHNLGLNIPSKFKGTTFTAGQVKNLASLKERHSKGEKITQAMLERALEDGAGTLSSPKTRKVIAVEKRIQYDIDAEKAIIEQQEKLKKDSLLAFKAQQEAQEAWERTQWQAQLLLKQQSELEERERQLELSKKYVEVEVEVEVPEEVTTTTTTSAAAAAASHQQASKKRYEDYDSYSSYSESEYSDASADEIGYQVTAPKQRRRLRKQKNVTQRMMLVQYETSESEESSSGEEENRYEEVVRHHVERVQKFRKNVVKQMEYDEPAEAAYLDRVKEAERAAFLSLKIQQQAQKTYENAQAEATAALYLHKEAAERAEKKATVCVRMQQEAAKAYERAQAETLNAFAQQKEAFEALQSYLCTKKIVAHEIEEPYSEDEVVQDTKIIKVKVPKNKELAEKLKKAEEAVRRETVKVRMGGRRKSSRSRSRSRTQVRHIYHEDLNAGVAAHVAAPVVSSHVVSSSSSSSSATAPIIIPSSEVLRYVSTGTVIPSHVSTTRMSSSSVSHHEKDHSINIGGVSIKL